MAKKQEFTKNPYTNARITYKSNSAKERGNTKMWQLTTARVIYYLYYGWRLYLRKNSK